MFGKVTWSLADFGWSQFVTLHVVASITTVVAGITTPNMHK